MRDTIKKPHDGFTIVELLIVIVIISILAAVTVVAFSGLQKRAQNSAILSAVNSVEKSVKAYKSITGTHLNPSNALAFNTASGYNPNTSMSGVCINKNNLYYEYCYRDRYSSSSGKTNGVAFDAIANYYRDELANNNLHVPSKDSFPRIQIEQQAMGSIYYASGVLYSYNFYPMAVADRGVFLIYPQLGKKCGDGDIEVDPVQFNPNNGSNAYWGVKNDAVMCRHKIDTSL